MSAVANVPLTDIARPKQWPTLTRRDLKSSGFPVYGANGRIGFADQYNHEEPTIIIGCRGSCGEVHVTEPRAYVTGNSMALDHLDTRRVDQRYLVHFLRKRGFEDIVSGSSQPQITLQGLSQLMVPLPNMTTQRRIATILDKADAIRCKREQALVLADDFLRSLFLKMFGDPIVNARGLPKRPLGEFGKIVTGNTPPRSDPENFGDAIEWIKSDNVNTEEHFLTQAVEGLSVKGKAVGRIVPKGSILVTCIAGSPSSIGRAAIADRAVAFNQQINAITPNRDVNLYFLYAQFLVGKSLVLRSSTNSMKGMISKGEFQKIEFMYPEPNEQERFGRIFETQIKARKLLQETSSCAADLFSTLSHRAFSGEI